MEENKEVKQIDFAKIWHTIWKNRKTYMIVMPIVLVTTYLISLCIPRYYNCQISLAPESSTGSFSGSLGSIASSFGIGGLSKLESGSDALYVELYPKILSSTDFLVKLMPIEIETIDGKIKCNYYTYLNSKQKKAPWDKLRGAIGDLFTEKQTSNYSGKESIDFFKLTKTQSNIFDLINTKIKCNVDKKTSVATITVEDQDPLVSAIIAKATCDKLQEFIVDYRTKKARIDYEYYQKLLKETKEEYEKARVSYSGYSDSHKHMTLVSGLSKGESMQNDMQQKFNMYTAVNTQLQAAHAKLQEATPAFTIIQSATLPTRPAGPKRLLLSLEMMILSFFVISVIVLFKEKTGLS